MRRLMNGVASAILVAALAACYHATIETGAPPSPQTLEQAWASSWVFGLVPPKAVEAASKCPNGVARVETQLSFLNQLVGVLTFGIYTPMSIKVTCAAAGTASGAAGPVSEIVVSHDAIEAWQQALTQAVHRSAMGGMPALVRFEEVD